MFEPQTNRENLSAISKWTHICMTGRGNHKCLVYMSSGVMVFAPASSNCNKSFWNKHLPKSFHVTDELRYAVPPQITACEVRLTITKSLQNRSS